MIGALWILAFVIVIGVILYIGELRWRNKNLKESVNDSSDSIDRESDIESNPVDNIPAQEECCGLHLVCEKDSLSPMSAEIIYYDDEELDRFIGRTPDSYNNEEIEEFRDVLMTLRREDIHGWARSITQRNLQLPDEIRDELLMLVNEIRSINTF